MNVRWIHAIAAAGALMVMSHASAAGPEMIVNGSFESPAYGASGIYGSTADDWIASIDAPEAIVNGQILDNEHHRYGRTPYGEQYLGMDPRSTNGFMASFSQVVPGFVAGQTYLVTLDAADSDGGKAPVLQVWLNDGSSGTYAKRKFDLPVGGPYGNVIQFNKLHVLFTSPVNGTITLTLTNVGDDSGGQDPGSISVDNVSIVSLSPDEAAARQAADRAPSTGFKR